MTNERDEFLEWVRATHSGFSQSGGKINLDERQVRGLFAEVRDADASLLQLRGNLTLAEEGLANYALEVQRLRATLKRAADTLDRCRYSEQPMAKECYAVLAGTRAKRMRPTAAGGGMMEKQRSYREALETIVSMWQGNANDADLTESMMHVASEALTARAPEPGEQRTVTTVGDMLTYTMSKGHLDTAPDLLSPCPFCGAPGAFTDGNRRGMSDNYTVSAACSNTSCGVRTPEHYHTRDDAAYAWNRRPGMPSKRT